MLKQTLKLIDTLLAIALVFVLGGFLALYGWISWKPRDVTEHVPKVLEALNMDLTEIGYDLHFKRAVIRNDGFSAPLLLSVDGLHLKNPRGEELLDIPKLKVSPSLTALLQGRFFPGYIDIIGADFAILQDAAGVFYLDTREQVAPMRLDSVFFPGEEKKEVAEADEFNFEGLFELGLNRLNISGASVQFKSEATGLTLSLPNVSAYIDSVLLSEEVRGGLSLSYINTQNQPSAVQGKFHYDHRNNTLSSDILLHQITPSQFAAIGKQLADLEKIKVPLSGKVVSQVVFPNRIEVLQFDLRSQELAGLNMQGNIGGTFEQPSFDVRGTMGKFSLPLLKEYWPAGVGEDAYRWIDQSLKEATVEKAEFSIRLDDEILRQPELPKEAVNAVLHIEDATIDYVPGFPQVNSAKGRVKFQGQSLLAEIDSVQMLQNTQLHRTTDEHKMATVEIPNLMLDNIHILLNIPLRAAMSDVLKFVEATPYRVPSSLNLDRGKLQGTLQGLLSMHIVDQISPVEDDVDFELDAKLNGVAYAGLVKQINLSGLNGTVKADNSSLKLSAGGKLDQNDFDVNLNIGGGAERYNYTGYLPVPVLAMLDKDISSQLSGAMNVDLKWEQSGAKESAVTLTADTRGVSYSLPDLGISKQSGQSGKIEASGTVSKNRVFLNSVHFSDPAFDFSGTLGISRGTGKVLNSTISSLRMGKTRVKGNYQLKEEQHQLELTGPLLDVEGFRKDEGQSSKTILQRLADIPNAAVDISFDEIRFGPDKGIQDARLIANCMNGRCQSFSLKMRSGETPFSARIGSVDGRRNFSANTPDLGRILRATGAFESLRNGKLQLNAIYQDDKPNRPMAGRLTLENFNVRDVPILAKLLTMATFTGILDTLSGGGLSFQKMVVPFTYDTQKLIIQDARAVGPSVGITAEGSLDVKPNELRVEGAVIPAKILDTVLTEIPILGDVYEAITGGEGLVAMNYSMKGNADDPTISVNPLSALTPGFLRGFFDIFDRSTATEKKDANATKKALESVEEDIQEMEDEASPNTESLKGVEETPEKDSFLRKKR